MVSALPTKVLPSTVLPAKVLPSTFGVPRVLVLSLLSLNRQPPASASAEHIVRRCVNFTRRALSAGHDVSVQPRADVADHGTNHLLQEAPS